MSRTGIVVVNFHAAALVRRAVDGLNRHLRSGAAEIVVVDNSVDSEEAEIRRDHPEIAYLRPGANLGFAGGCNAGIRHCLERGCEFVLLLNPDTRVEEDILSPLIALLRRFPAAGAVAPRIVYDDDKRGVWYGGAALNWWRGGPKQIFDNRFQGREVVTVPCLSGCAMLLRAEAVRRCGEMDESYFLYYEDTDYCLRLRAAGWELLYAPRVTVLHAASATVGFQSTAYVYYFSRNRIRLLRRWAPWGPFLSYLLFIFLVKIPGAWLVFGLGRRRPCLARAFGRGVVHGLLGRTGPWSGE